MKVMNVIIEIDWKAMCAERDLIIERLEIENAHLSSSLSANATMLARQCDLARDAERNELVAIRDLAIEVANHEATQRSLFACNEGIMEQYKEISRLKRLLEEAARFVSILFREEANKRYTIDDLTLAHNHLESFIKRIGEMK
jgi:hypothetical protein